MWVLSPEWIPNALEGTEYGTFLFKLLVFAVVSTVTYLIGRYPALALVDRLLLSDRVTPTVRRPARRFARAAVVFVAFFSGLFFARLETLLSVTGGMAAALTLAVGFASRDILGNLVGGLFIISDPMFNIGDWIEWEDNEGIIEDISFRVTRVRTFKNELITVPNSMLAGTIVTNHAINDRLRIDFELGIEFDADVDVIRRVLREEAAANPRILDDPEPRIEVTEVTAAGIDVVARVWIADPTRAKYLSVRSEFLQSVTERFRAEGFDLSPDLLEVTGDLGGDADAVRSTEGKPPGDG